MTIAELKRDIANKNLEAEMVYRYGEEIPERLKGVRPLLRSNSVAIFFRNANGAESELRIPRSNLIEYTGDSLKIFCGGERPLTDEEDRLLNEWKAIENAIPPYEESYWRRKKFFTDRKAEHLLGYEKVRGMKLIYARGNDTPKVYDEKIRGALAIEYRIREV